MDCRLLKANSEADSVKKIGFFKMHGLGNDFVVIDAVAQAIELLPAQAVKLCDRRFGVGADQVLVLRKPENPQADIFMQIYNADGSIAEMCGNGIRAVALFLYKKDGEQKRTYKIETLAGLKTVTVNATGDRVIVDMGVPHIDPIEELEAPAVQFNSVNVGNPHAVIFVPNLKQVPIQELGPQIETHKRFPRRTNVEFVEVESAHKINVGVWERGAGVTLACGTGACAAAVAALSVGKVKSPVEVQLPGGTLTISWEGPGRSLYMEGPAVEVFCGEIELVVT